MVKLNVNTIKKDNNKFLEKKRITFENGNYLDIQKYFSNEKIKEIFNTMTKINEEAKELNMMDEMNKYNFLDFITLIIVEIFTDLEFSKNTKTKLREYKTLFDSDYYQQIIKEFEQKEIQKVFIQMSEQMNALQTLQTQMLDVKQQISKINNDKETLFPEAYPKGNAEK